jgi:hypothetical protein
MRRSVAATIYASTRRPGAVRWKFVTIEKPWRYTARRRAAAGSGIRSRWTPRQALRGQLESVRRGAARPSAERCRVPGRRAYTDSLIVLDARRASCSGTTRLRRTTSAITTSRRRRSSPTVGGAEPRVRRRQGGRVIAWDPREPPPPLAGGCRVHENDSARFPALRDRLPGSDWRRRDADGLRGRPCCSCPLSTCAVGAVPPPRKMQTTVDPSRGKGRLVALEAATGHVLGERRLPSPDFGCATVSNDVVFTSAFDGRCTRSPSATGSSSGTNGCGRHERVPGSGGTIWCLRRRNPAHKGRRAGDRGVRPALTPYLCQTT